MALDAPGSRAIRVSGRSAWQAALLELAQSAQRELCVQSHHLEAFAYGDAAFVEAVKEMILGNRRAQVRVLLNDVGPAAKGHRLVDLGRSLSSFVQFRQLSQTDRDNLEDRVIVDRAGFIERLDPESLEALHYPNAPADTRRRLEGFEQLWARAAPSPQLRALFI